MAKLIRDLIPEDMRSHGYEPELIEVQGPQRRKWLLKKLREESAEAYDSDGALDELGDVLEGLRSIAEDAGHTLEDVIAAADDKAARRGRFERGYVWVNDCDRGQEALAARRAYEATEAEVRR